MKAYKLTGVRYDQDGCEAYSDTRGIIIGDGMIKQDNGEYKPLMPEDYWYGSTLTDEEQMLKNGWDEVAEVWVLEISDELVRNSDENAIRRYAEDAPESAWDLLRTARLSNFFRSFKKGER